MPTTQQIHAFEAAVLGVAPFDCFGMIDAGKGSRALCQFCGTEIRYRFQIRSADGRTFHVGSECVTKTGDAGLIKAVNQVKKEARNARRDAEAATQRAICQANLADQRKRNGGLTDYELAQKIALENMLKWEAANLNANGWLLDLLCGQNGPWATTTRNHLLRFPAKDLSKRTRTILAELYAKRHGRKGSLPYDAALAKAQSQLFII